MTGSDKIKNIIKALLILLLLSHGAYAQNQWDENGIRVADATDFALQAISDDSGGVYFVYEEGPSDDIDIIAQWIDEAGNAKWSSSGITVINTLGNQVNPSIASDGAGGIYVAWQDDFSDTSKIFIQHITKEGGIDWNNNGIEICTEKTIQQEIKLISDNNNGVFAVWKDKRNDAADIYIQHVISSGTRSWPDSGVAVTNANGLQSDYKLICTNSGDLIVVWVDERDGNMDIYAQKISATGNAQWTTDGTAIVTETSVQYHPAVETCGNKYIITWTDKRNDNGDIYAQLIDENGITQWSNNGIVISNASDTQDGSCITESYSSSVIISWWDSRSGGYDIYAQRIDSLGNQLWANVVNNYTNYQYLPDIISDGAGGAFIVWMDSRNDYYDLFSQHLNKDGQYLWDSDGISLVSVSGYQAEQKMVSDRSGGVITLWRDQRDSQNDIYAQLTNDNIAVTYPSSSEIWNGTVDQTITWSMNTEDVIFSHFSLKALIGGVEYSIADNISPSQLNHIWSSPGITSNNVKIKIQAMNTQDSVICSYLSDAFTIDSESPLEFGLLSPASNDTVEKIITFEWEPTTDNLTGLSHYELWIDGSLFLDDLLNTTYTLSQAEALSIGPHTWTIRAVDSAGVYYEPAEYSIEVVYDNTPPEEFHLLNPGNNAWSTVNNPLFRWESSSDAGRMLKSYKFYLDGSFVADISPDKTSFSEPIVTPGNHTWYVTAVDSADNTTKSAETWTVRMDNEPPFSFSLLQPESDTWFNDTTPEFSWEQTSDTSTGIGLAEYELWIDETLIIDDISGDNQVVQLPTSKSLTEGTHTWYIKAKDSLENSRNSQAEFTVNIDVTQPSAFNLTAPGHESFINTLNPNFSWTASEDNLSGLKKYQLGINGSLNKDNITALQTNPAALLTEGKHTWSVTSLDSAGNARHASTFTFTADTTSPQHFHLVYPEDQSTLYINTPQLSWQTAQDQLSGINKYTLILDGEVVADNIPPDDTAYSITQSLDNGTHTWQITTCDSAGNTRSTETFQFEVCCNPPVITSSNWIQAEEDVLLTYTAQAEDPDQQEVTISFIDYPTWLTPSQNSISGIPREGDQDTSFTVIATDGLYYDSLLIEVPIKPVNDPPVITSPKNASAVEDEQFTYIVSAQDPDDEVLQYIFKDYPSWLTPVDTYITGTPTEGKTDTSFTLIVTDGKLSDTLKVSITITPLNDPPQITSPHSITVKEDSLLSYTVTAEDPDNEVLNFDYIEYPSWLSVSDQTIEGIAREHYADTSFTVSVTDGSLSDTSKVSVHIIYINDPPVITSSNTAAAFEDSLFTYIPEAEDSDSDTIFYDFSDYPSWLSPGTNKITGTPTEGNKDSSFKVIASDGELYDTLKVTITVIPVNDPPYITSPDTAKATEKEFFSYLAKAEDIDSKDITISFTDYPSWLSVSGAKIKGTPGDNCQDTTFIVIASDGHLSDSLKVTITVIPVNDPPVFIKPLPKDTTISSQDTLMHNLGDFINDPDDPLSSLSWHHTVLDTNTLTITFNQKTHIVKINGRKTNGKVSIIFKVSDPQDSSAQDTLQFSIHKNTSINDFTLSEIPDHFILEDNFPNPFNNFTTIKYGLPQRSPVTLCIYNMLGQKVAEIIDHKKQAAGFHQIHWDSGSLPSGIYFYHLKAGSWDAIKKMILMK